MPSHLYNASLAFARKSSFENRPRFLEKLLALLRDVVMGSQATEVPSPSSPIDFTDTL